MRHGRIRRFGGFVKGHIVILKEAMKRANRVWGANVKSGFCKAVGGKTTGWGASTGLAQFIVTIPQTGGLLNHRNVLFPVRR